MNFGEISTVYSWPTSCMQQTCVISSRSANKKPTVLTNAGNSVCLKPVIGETTFSFSLSFCLVLYFLKALCIFCLRDFQGSFEYIQLSIHISALSVDSSICMVPLNPWDGLMWTLWRQGFPSPSECSEPHRGCTHPLACSAGLRMRVRNKSHFQFC